MEQWEQTTMLSQYDIDKSRFLELFSKFTGISKKKIYNFLENNPTSAIFEHPTAMDINKIQLTKVNQLKELNNLYNNLKSYDKEYKITSSDKAGEYFREYFSGVKDKEYFVCSFLDNSNRIIATKIVSTGTVNEAPVYPREITKMALLYDARSVILAHNHPGGSVLPSKPDIDVTRSIANALSVMKIQVMDHIIVADDRYISLQADGYNIAPSLIIAETDNSAKERIIEQYNKEYPAIKYISENAAQSIENLNHRHGRHLSIKEIKSIYSETGKRLEHSNNISDVEMFTQCQNVIDNLKQAQLTEKNIKYKEQVASKNKLSNSINMEIN